MLTHFTKSHLGKCIDFPGFCNIVFTVFQVYMKIVTIGKSHQILVVECGEWSSVANGFLKFQNMQFPPGGRVWRVSSVLCGERLL